MDAEREIRKAELFLEPPNDWVHIDVSDGEFTEHVSWGDPEELASVGTRLNTGIHLMVNQPEEVLESWLQVHVDRVVVHVQAVRDMHYFLDMCKKYDVQAVLSVDPSQPVDALFPYVGALDYFQILRVTPGPSGQKPDPDSIVKIRALRERAPTAKIIVDGGVSEENAVDLVSAGADVLVSGHFIFGSPDPARAHHRLLEVANSTHS